MVGKRPLHFDRFDRPGKEARSGFLKASGRRAGEVGQACRKEKLAAGKDDTCKEEVQGHVDWAATTVKKSCG